MCAIEAAQLAGPNQGNTTNLNIIFPMKKELLRWGLHPQHTTYKVDALPIELPRQLSWLDRIKAIQGQPV